MDDLKKTGKKHSVTMENRELIHMTGINDVLSFDEELVICESDMGVLILKGDNLHVNKLDLDNGVLDVDGNIVSLEYEENHVMSKNKPSILSKIFK